MAKIADRIRLAGTQFARSGTEALPGWLLNIGIACWMLVGLAAVLVLSAWFVAASASITIPLILAMVIGMIARPLVERMSKRGVPVSLAATLVLLLLIGIASATVWVVVAGVISQWPSISAQFQSATDQIGAALTTRGIDTESVTAFLRQMRSEASSAASTAGGGILSMVGSVIASGLSSVFALLFGVFIGAVLLFYVLTDFDTIAHYVGGHMGGLPVDLGEAIVEDAVGAMRGYFRGTTLTGIAVATVIGLTMLVMRIPLAGSVAVVTFLTCYIPFFGAIISGIFAFFIALGSSGFTNAVILLVVILLAQNLLQTVINARVMGESLNLHPLVVLVVTMLGGIFGGLLGAALAAPAAALFMSAAKRLATVDLGTAPEMTPAEED
jgi:predicted PurR-regulated permease PerM